MVIAIGNGFGDSSSNSEIAICISHCANKVDMPLNNQT